MRGGTCRVSMVIDTLLLLAGASLWWLMQHNPLHEPWFATKLLLLPVYVLLGAGALKRASTPRGRLACLMAACAVVTTMAWLGLTKQFL